MKKLQSFIFITLGFILLLPFMSGAIIYGSVVRLRCWVRGKHMYNPQHLLMGIPLKSLCCMRCLKPISPEEEPRMQAEVDVYFMELNVSRQFLNDLFKTPEEKAIEKLIDETKN